jgi:NAD(P)-dependent dehydrogenase (short-subunit alcohol dehydrogenase family)
VTKAFLEEGARVVASYVVDGEVDEVRDLVGERGDALGLRKADLFQEAAVGALVDWTVEDLGGLDVLVNVVGGYLGGVDLVDTTREDWTFMMDLNLTSVFLCCRAAVPHLLEAGGGKVVNVASSAGLAGEAGHAAYSASKAGVLRLTESLTAEVRERGVHVNCVLPSIVDTPANREAMPKADFAMWPKPGEVARVILFLASEDAALLHGASVPVYGRSP